MASTKTVEVENIGAVVLSGIDTLTMDDFADWVDAEKNGDFRAARPFYAKLVESWALKLDPKDVKSYGKLTLVQHRSLSEAVTGYLSSLGKA